jgi:hypothetical protein
LFKVGIANLTEAPSLQVEFIADSFYSGNTIQPKFLADLADMHIDRPVPNDHLVTPNLVQDLIA